MSEGEEFDEHNQNHAVSGYERGSGGQRNTFCRLERSG